MECNAAKEILFARNNFEQAEYPKLEFRLLSDSNYIFYYQTTEWAATKTEMSNGRYSIKSDTIVFHPTRFQYINCDKAIIKDGFVEFLNGKHPLRIKIQSTILNSKVSYDTVTFNKYAFFSYDRNHYNCFEGNVLESIDLDNSDVTKLDSILNISITKSKSISYKPNQYFKQCIAIIDSNGHKVVWINLTCGNMYYKYGIDYVNDGGDCFANLKINLTKLTWYDLSVNGIEGE